MNTRIHFTPLRSGAFTLVELLVSMAILTLLLLVLVQITDSTRKTWVYTTEKISEFREAREAYEALTRRLAQATLNTYWDYSPAPPAAPTKYVRQSELRFICGPTESLVGTATPPRPSHGVFFQAPVGYSEDAQNRYTQLQNLLNTWGFYIEWNSDTNSRPPFITSPLRYRFRLMELMEPSEGLSLYKYTNGNPTPPYTGRDWFRIPMKNTTPPLRTRVMAENMLLMVLAPQLSTVESGVGGLIGANYTYDSTVDGVSKNQLPPLIRVTLLALDETTFARYQKTSQNAPPWLTGKFTNFGATDADMKSVTDQLIANHIKYRSFTTVIPIRAAKWSTN